MSLLGYRRMIRRVRSDASTQLFDDVYDAFQELKPVVSYRIDQNSGILESRRLTSSAMGTSILAIKPEAHNCSRNPATLCTPFDASFCCRFAIRRFIGLGLQSKNSTLSKLGCVAFLGFFGICFGQSPNSFTTLAGNPATYGSVDGTGSTATFYYPSGVVVDAGSNVYVSDTYNNTIRKISPGGTVSTLAGLAGSPGNTDGTGSAARFRNPTGLAVDVVGNIYVADSFNHTIRKISAAGAVTTLAGSAGNPGSVDGTGSVARFLYPNSVAIDPFGNVLVADYGNSTIRKITSGGTVSTLAGLAGTTGSVDGAGTVARFSNPASIAVDGAGNAYVTDYGNCTIRKVNTVGVVTTIAGTAGSIGSPDGTGSAARFDSPSGLAIDSGGNVYVADRLSQTIRKITTTGAVSTVAGSVGVIGSTNGVGGTARFSFPTGMALDAFGNLYVADYGNSTIRKAVPSTAPAAITTQPANQTALVGANVTFSVVASGSPAPTYQWRKGGSNILGATNASLTLFNVQPVDAGAYSVVATNGTGSDTSIDAVLTVQSSPAITTQPVSKSVFVGTNVTFTVVANGIPAPTYQWKKNGGDISGATSGSLSLPNVQPGDTGFYTVVVTNVAGSVTSNLASLTVNTPPGFIADFNADSKSDLIWQNTATGERYVWLMNGTGVGSIVSLGTISTNWQIAGTGDFNADGFNDLVLQNSATGERYIWLMNGVGFVSSVNLGTITVDWQIAGVGDFNGDGRPDLLWQNTISGERYIWFMNGTVASSYLSLGGVATQWQIAGVGDFNGDSKPDILWQNTVTGERFIWLMNGPAMTTSVGLGTVTTDWSIAGSGDFNGDNQADILWQNTVTGDRYVWLMNGTTLGSSVFLATIPIQWQIRN